MNITQEQIVAVLRGEKVEIDGMRLAWRSVHPDFRSSHGFRWPFPGQTATADPKGRKFTKGDPCPQFDGDGLCLALTWRGAASGGIPASTALICAYSEADALGADSDKVRVPFAHVIEVVDIEAVARSGAFGGANLRGASLRRAYLYGADLSEAILSRANLGRASLSWANLSRANLSEANLGEAYLSGANLGEWERGPDGYARKKDAE